MIYITKDAGEKLDYVFIRAVEDNISAVTYTQSVGSTITVVSCTVNTNVVTDSDGNEYPAGRAVVLWVQGGVVGTTETITLQYTTVAGRILDEDIQFRINNGC
jgi:hypothetical protein